MGNHIARDGEQEFASIHRNRSGQDAGRIDYGIRVETVENLSPDEKQDLLVTARVMVSRLEEYCKC